MNRAHAAAGRSTRNAGLDKGIDSGGNGNGSRDLLMEDLGEFLEDGSFESLEHLQAETDRFTPARNSVPVDDLDGLSAEKRRLVVFNPLFADSPVTFNMDAAVPGDAPFLRLLAPVIHELGKGSLKATATGNLHLKLVKAVANEWSAEMPEIDRRHYSRIRSEKDFVDFHTVRLIAWMGGFIKKRHQRFSLTKRGESVLLNGVNGEVFLRLMEVYIRKYNWAYWDRHPELSIVQISAFYTLYLLQKYGDEDRPQSFYSDKFMAAFPMAMNEFDEDGSGTPEKWVHSCFTGRAMNRFAHLFGFMEYVGEDVKWPFTEERIVRKTPFLDDFISFRFG